MRFAIKILDNPVKMIICAGSMNNYQQWTYVINNARDISQIRHTTKHSFGMEVDKEVVSIKIHRSNYPHCYQLFLDIHVQI